MSESPADRYKEARQRASHPGVRAFAESLPFDLDGFQMEGCRAVEDGRSVLVAAPTGAGKTVVGEFAVRCAKERGEKAFYTTPIKALSNQKYRDLTEAYGPKAVGLLTGDTSVNGNADIVVMTTEVLRNMIYAGSSTLERLGVVILDEVHYLADRFRGSVWEEILVHLDSKTEIVALSATVSNTEEFGAWLKEVRGDTEVVVSETRPVPLWQHVMLREGLFDLYAPGVDPTDPGSNPRLNPDLEAVVRRLRHAPRHRGHRGPRGVGRRPPPRFAVVDVLDSQGLLPAIVFVFSRAGCEDAVDQIRSAGLRLTTDAERARIVSIVEERCSGFPGSDLGALGYAHWLDHLEQGIAAHHAGMIPLFKEVVETLFTQGLIKVVFATETLSLGINMPARSVVLEKLVKWDGDSHKDLTPGEYTQLTGRAGRRGIDVEGHAVVVEYPGFDVEILGRLASKRTYPLISSFKPSYNMAINLVARSGVAKAREVLEMSFAQYQADRAVVSQARRVRDLDSTIAGYRESVACSRGDFLEYAGLKEKISQIEKADSRAATRDKREANTAMLKRLRAGAVVRILGGRHRGLAVVVSPDRSELPRPLVVTESGRAFRLSVADLHNGMDEVGAIRLPKRVDTRRAQSRRDLSSVLNVKRGEFTPTRRKNDQGRGGPSREEVDDLRKRMREHPCHSCPDRDEHSRWSERYFRALRDRDRLTEEISRETGSIARIFDRRCGVLVELGYLSGEGEDLSPTSWGTMLRTIYSENDLVIAECLRKGVWTGLPPAALAAAVSSVVYEGRREDENQTPRIPQGPSGPLGLALRETVRVSSGINDLHTDRRLPRLQAPQWGIVGPVHSWTQGKGLDAVLRGSEIAPGDLVRWFKQVIDVLDQIAEAAPDPTVRLNAERAIAGMRRGVVAY
ncbi:MAG: DEAD/DEAH box helicase [Demequinaceae bacterium]|nr:DEAD/DEAH box helicase [Demequinaceae bacterium]